MTDTATRIVFVLDKTGSMRLEPRYANTIAGFNTWLKEMQGSLPEAAFSLIMFNSFGTTVVHRNARLGDVDELTPAQYQCDGWTPLFEAICKAIEATEKVVGPDERVVITILTDGEENSSCAPYNALSYVAAKVKEKQDLGWQFVFLGANMDAWKAREGTNISAVSTMSYDSHNLDATQAAFRSAARRTSHHGVTGQSVKFDDQDLAAAGSDKFAQRPAADEKSKTKGTVEIDL